LLATIIARPDLAACIEHVSFLPTRLEDPSPNGEMWYPPEVQQGDIKSSTCQTVISAAKDIISNSHIPFPEKWIQAIEDGDIYAFVALLISQLHNLRTLRLDYTFVWHSGWPGIMMKHALSPTQTGMSRFSCLRDVEYGVNVPAPVDHEDAYNEISNMEGFPPCNPDQFAGWFHLPYLRALEIWLQNVDDLLYDLALRQSRVHIERLVLVHVSTEEQLAHLLHLIGPVKSLHLGLVYHSFRVPRLEPLSQVDALVQALTPMRDTLKHLSIGLEFHPNIGFREKWNEQASEEGLDSFQGILKDFIMLESVEIPWMMLCGLHPKPTQDMATLLPKSLQRLCLRNDLWMVLDEHSWAIAKLIKALQLSLPSLRTTMPDFKQLVVKFFGQRFRDIRREEFKEFSSSCSDMGMDLEFSVLSDGLQSGLWTGSRPLMEWVNYSKPLEWKRIDEVVRNNRFARRI
jgi:hypothetical protein